MFSAIMDPPTSSSIMARACALAEGKSDLCESHLESTRSREEEEAGGGAQETTTPCSRCSPSREETELRSQPQGINHNVDAAKTTTGIGGGGGPSKSSWTRLRSRSVIPSPARRQPRDSCCTTTPKSREISLLDSQRAAESRIPQSRVSQTSRSCVIVT